MKSYMIFIQKVTKKMKSKSPLCLASLGTPGEMEDIITSLIARNLNPRSNLSYISLLASDNQDHAGFVVQIRPSVRECAVARMPPAGLEDRDQLAHAKYAPERAFFGAPVA